MNLETHYAPWKTYIRNMDFLEKRLTVLAEENELEGGMYLVSHSNTLICYWYTLNFHSDTYLGYMHREAGLAPTAIS